MYVCMYYVYVCIYVCMYVCMFVSIMCMYLCMYVCMFVSIMCMYVSMYVSMYVCMCVCVADSGTQFASQRPKDEAQLPILLSSTICLYAIGGNNLLTEISFVSVSGTGLLDGVRIIARW